MSTLKTAHSALDHGLFCICLSSRLAVELPHSTTDGNLLFLGGRACTHDSLGSSTTARSAPIPHFAANFGLFFSTGTNGSDRITYWPGRAAGLRSDFSTGSCSLPAPPPCVIIIPLSRLQGQKMMQLAREKKPVLGDQSRATPRAHNLLQYKFSRGGLRWCVSYPKQLN